MDAEAYVRRLIEGKLEELAKMPSENAARLASTFSAEVRAATDALVAAGALEETSGTAAAQGFSDELVKRGLLKMWSVSMGSSIGPLVASRRPDARDRPLPPPRPTVRPTPEIVRVLPAIHDFGTPVEPWRIVLVAVEIWSGWLVVRSMCTRPESETLDRQIRRPRSRSDEPRYAWRVEDDLGTVYEPGGSSWSGSSNLYTQQWQFSPPPPTGARTLTVVLHRRIEPDPETFARHELGEELARVALDLAPTS